MRIEIFYIVYYCALMYSDEYIDSIWIDKDDAETRLKLLKTLSKHSYIDEFDMMNPEKMLQEL